MIASILMRDGTRVPLFMNTENGRPTEAGKKIKNLTSVDGNDLVSLPWVTSITIEDDLSYLPKISVTLNPPFLEGRRFLDSELIEWGVSAIEVQVGYSTGTGGPVLTPPLQALLMKPDVAIGQDIVITLHGRGVAGHSLETQCASRQWSTTSDSKYRKDVIADCLKGTGREIKLNLDFIKQGTQEYELLFKTPIELSQGWLTDWMMIRKIVRDCRCWMRMRSFKKNETDNKAVDELVIYAQNDKMGEEPKYTMRLYDLNGGVIGPASGDFPILGFRSGTSAMWLPGSTMSITGVDSKTGTIRRAIRSVSEDQTNTTGGGSVDMKGTSNRPEADKNTGDGGHNFPFEINSPNANQQLQAEVLNLKSLMGVDAEIDTVGIVDLAPGDVVAVRGVGRRFDYNYSVFNTRMTVGDGFFMSMKLRSNSAKYLDALKVDAEAVNDKAAKEPTNKTDIVPKPIGKGMVKQR